MASGSKPRGVNPRAARGKRTGKAKLSGGDMPKGDLIVIANAEAKVRSNRNGAPTAAGADMGQLTALFDPANVNLIPLFGRPEDRLQREAPPLATMAAVHDTRAPDLSLFYRVDAPHEQLADLAESLRRNDSFEAAYIKPFTERPQFNTQAPAMGDPPPATPDFTKCQGYLNPAPEGVDAHYAWTFDGGNGAGVGIIDIEGAWRFSHEVLSQLGGVAGGIQLTDLDWRNHGTAVLGVMGGAGKGFGVTGICPAATIRSISHGGPQQTTATAIRQAADLLSPGDIILLEAHRPGPQSPTPFTSNPLQQGYIAIEWWPDDYAAIVYAVRKGIIVVGAAGNGAVSLDAPIYDQHPNAAGSFGPFPTWWENPFRRVNLDSGAILVGAGAPFAGNGAPSAGSFGPDRSRLAFSNFGLPVDAQGWGHGVVSTGYGDLQGPKFFEDLWYTRDFNGTSSASPIVVGALACLQGAIKKAGRPLLTSMAARNLLRSTGSLQTQPPGSEAAERIGNRPDLRQLLSSVGIGPKLISEGQGQQEPKEKPQGNDDKAKGSQPDVVTQKNGPDNRPGPSAEGQQADAGKSLTERLDKLEARLDQLVRFIGVQI